MISDHLNHLKAFADFKSSAGFAKWFKLSFNVQKKIILFECVFKDKFIDPKSRKLYYKFD